MAEPLAEENERLKRQLAASEKEVARLQAAWAEAKLVLSTKLGPDVAAETLGSSSELDAEAEAALREAAAAAADEIERAAAAAAEAAAARSRKRLERKAQKAEQELKLVKALLLLKNVEVKVDLDEPHGGGGGGGSGGSGGSGGGGGGGRPDSGRHDRLRIGAAGDGGVGGSGSMLGLGRGAGLLGGGGGGGVGGVGGGGVGGGIGGGGGPGGGLAAKHPLPIAETGQREHLHLAGDPRLLQELMAIKNQVKLLSHCCYVLRAQVMQLNQAIPLTTKRVYQAAHKAIASQTQQRRSLQGRLDKLVRLFN